MTNQKTELPMVYGRQPYVRQSPLSKNWYIANSVGPRQAVEAAIDGSKASQTQTWDQAAAQSRLVPPWSKIGHEKKCRIKD